VTTLVEPPAVEPAPNEPASSEPASNEPKPRWRPDRWAPTRPRWPLNREATAVAAVVGAILVVQGWNITGFPTASDDEGTYLAQAWAVQNGLGLAHYTYWYDHPPLGWIQLAVISWVPELFLPDDLAVPAARYAMLLVTGVSLVLLYVLAKRLGLPRWAAMTAIVLFGLSPLAVTMQRQIYLDSFAVAWMLAAFVLALSPRRHLWHHVGAGAAAAVAVLSKETILVALPGLVVALWQGSARGPRAFSLAGFTSGLVLVGAFYPLYALLNREFFPGPDHVSLIAAIQFQLQERPGSGSIFTPGTGSHALLQSWLYYDPVILAAGLVATAIALAVKQLRAPAVASAALCLMAMRPGGYLPAMYVVQVLPFFALVMAGVVAVLATGRIRRAVALATAAVVTVPLWYQGIARAVTADDNGRYRAAAAWLERVPKNSTLVLDDVLWLDAVRSGFARERVIWFYKLDLDSAVTASLPGGWRDVDYVVSTPVIRSDPNALPTVAALFEHSTVVATFGSGADRIDIRQVSGSAR
jgi:4-amino-4-deoxy-L-arabinose transferase-like glycosyltransferase